MSRNLVRDIERSTGRIGRNAHIALRAERVIARRRLAVFRTQTGLMAFAGAVASIGIVMVNVGLFFWLAESNGNAAAGGILAALNFGLAVILVLVASRMSAERELEPVIEVRDLAMEDIEAEIAEGLDEAKVLAENVRRMASDPFGSIGTSLLAQVIPVLVNSLKK
ncbi:MAG: hypothetical protein AAF678_00305 [Pseudomonadota bacterium]